MSARLQVPTKVVRLSHSRPRIAFVGLGWIGRKRLDALVSEPDAQFGVAALVDSDTERLRAAASVHPDASVAPTIDALFDEGLDAVVIATPNGLHAAQAIACLEHGLSVFCQKPLATTLHDVRRVLAAAREADRLLGIDFCYRHISGMHELRQRLRSGALGEIVAVDLVFHNAYGPDKSWCRERALAGGGCLLDLGVHLLDLALWVQDAPPMERVRSRLFADGQPLQGCDGPLEDLAYAEFIQPNGAIVRLSCSWHAHIGQPARIQMEITGTRGGASWSNVDGSFYDFDVHWFQGTNRERLGMSRDDWGTRALDAWLQRLRASNRFDPEAEHIVRSAELIEEVYRA
ncbi:Gfo/Idh/MocA family protein [Steroidobacter flavus]|uniref:Gfo/Idh/MocA family protein n=1 Tax=Steroidobacter flavus TaxID=1842136 RepID=A0ABV8SQM8_9GAMM